MTCVSEKYGEVPTLHIDTGRTGGFSELRPYTEVAVFIVVNGELSAPPSPESKDRAFRVLNHFLDIYSMITQDPYVRRIDRELDIYLIDFAVASVPPEIAQKPARAILDRISDIHFPTQVGKGRQLQYRVNTLEDLFPGQIIEKPYLDLLAQLVAEAYKVPLHYELIFAAQRELKHRNHHIAIIEAETAFEAYVAKTLVESCVATGVPRQDILDPLTRRLERLDKAVRKYRELNGLPPVTAFVGSAEHSEWKTRLYKVRNRVVHEGWRSLTFDDAKRGIAACKAAIKYIEDQLPTISDRIQIAPGLDHLTNTAGRLTF